MAAAKAAATNLEQKLKSLVDAVDADAAAQVYAGAFGGLSLGESMKTGPAPPSSWSDGDGVKTATSVYAGAAQALEALASKAPLVLQEPSVTTEAAQAICKDVEKAANELQTAAALLQTDTAGAGAPLRAIARVNGRRLLDAWRSLAEALKTNKDVPQRTGIAWEAAQMCHKIPKSNRTAYRREFLQWAKELKDVLVEFEELLAQDYDEQEDAFDDPFGGLDDAYPPSDAPAAEAGIACLKVVGQLYKQALLTIDERGNAGKFDEVSSVYASADAVREAAVALGEELYAPLDADALRASLGAADQAVRRLAPLVAPAASDKLPPPPGLEQRWRAQWSAAVEAVKFIKS